MNIHFVDSERKASHDQKKGWLTTNHHLYLFCDHSSHSRLLPPPDPTPADEVSSGHHHGDLCWDDTGLPDGAAGASGPDCDPVPRAEAEKDAVAECCKTHHYSAGAQRPGDSLSQRTMYIYSRAILKYSLMALYFTWVSILFYFRCFILTT